MDESRRSFLRAVGAAAAVTALPAPTAAIDPIKRRGGPQMHLSLAAYSFRKYFADFRRGGATAK